jgi:hypothetical protein
MRLTLSDLRRRFLLFVRRHLSPIKTTAPIHGMYRCGCHSLLECPNCKKK